MPGFPCHRCGQVPELGLPPRRRPAAFAQVAAARPSYHQDGRRACVDCGLRVCADCRGPALPGAAGRCRTCAAGLVGPDLEAVALGRRELPEVDVWPETGVRRDRPDPCGDYLAARGQQRLLALRDAYEVARSRRRELLAGAYSVAHRQGLEVRELERRLRSCYGGRLVRRLV